MAYQWDPTRPAGDGWCEVVVSGRLAADPDRYCFTQARVGDDGRRVCGLHPDRAKVRLGPITGRAPSRDGHYAACHSTECPCYLAGTAEALSSILGPELHERVRRVVEDAGQLGAGSMTVESCVAAGVLGFVEGIGAALAELAVTGDVTDIPEPASHEGPCTFVAGFCPLCRTPEPL